MNRFDATKADGTVQLTTGEIIASAMLPPLPDGPLTLAVRAHELGLAPRADGIALAGRVRVAEISGSETFVHVALGDGQDRVVQAPGVHRHEPESTVSVWLDPRRLFAFDADGRLLAAPGMG